MRWLGSSIVWLGAPFAGVAIVNLLFFAYFLLSPSYSPAMREHLGLAVFATIAVLAWVGLLWFVAQQYAGRARLAQVAVAGLLAVAGIAFVYLVTTPTGAAVNQVL